eukprot:10804390-Heterocapsa_arctica.AAC.1
MQPMTYAEMREIWALQMMCEELSHHMLEIMLEREMLDDTNSIHLSESEWTSPRRGHEDADMYDVLVDLHDEIWEAFSDDDDDTSSTDSTDEPLTVRDGSVRDISVDDSLSEEIDGKNTEDPDDKVTSQT